MVIVVATAVWHCPVLYILYSQKFLPYTDRRWLQQGVANVLLHGVKMYILSQFRTKIVCSFFLHRLKDKTLCWGCTYFLQIQAPHQCPRRQKGDTSHVHYWRHTHTHTLSTTIKNLVPWMTWWLGIFLPLPKVHSGTLLALNWYLERKCAQNGSMWFSMDGWDWFWLSALRGIETCLRS